LSSRKNRAPIVSRRFEREAARLRAWVGADQRGHVDVGREIDAAAPGASAATGPGVKSTRAPPPGRRVPGSGKFRYQTMQFGGNGCEPGNSSY
jgi:hypothetical protein